MLLVVDILEKVVFKTMNKIVNNKEKAEEDVWLVEPKPAFCVKFKDVKSGKVFVNFCVCEELPAPVTMDEDRLAEIIESDDPGSYRIPLSIGDPRIELDKSGDTCTAIDAIINANFYTNQIQISELFRTFTVLVAIEAIENRHKEIKLDRDTWTVLKNRKRVGELQSQRIRKMAKRPLIQELPEMSKTGQASAESPKTDSDVPFDASATGGRREPSYRFVNRQLSKGKWGVEATFNLAGVKSASEISLEVCENGIRLIAGEVYETELKIPVLVRTDGTWSEYSVDNETLKVVMMCHEL